MKLDLTKFDFFQDDEIIFDEKNTFIYGPNGTGKSTISNELKKKNDEYEIYVFQGFESVISENNKLNAIVLGTENTEISKQISEIELKIKDKEDEINEIKNTISKPDNSEVQNFYTRKELANLNYSNEFEEIEKFLKNAASSIKKATAELLGLYTYNKNSFQNDIKNALKLSDSEIEISLNTINTVEKSAKDIKFEFQDFLILYNEVKSIISQKINEPRKIVRLTSDKKRMFAKLGLEMHNPGDVCSFCGNKIDDKVFDELNSYFLAEDIKSYQTLINSKIDEINMLVTEVSNIDINVDDFYPEYKAQAIAIKSDVETKKNEVLNFLKYLKNSLEEKCKNLFELSAELFYTIPEDFSSISKQYVDLKTKNNNTKLKEKKEKEKEKLKYHYVKIEMEKFSYDEHIGKLEELKKQKLKCEDEFKREAEKISAGSELLNELDDLRKKRINLENQTVSETKLVDIINSKLKLLVSFELNHDMDENNKGIYNIKDTKNETIRNITQLSTGEKNIIAFLYFIEKINEVHKEVTKKPKLIVFDDPMSSNDDTMQYLIIEEIGKLKNQLSKNDIFILLTHNKHFYLNVKYRLDYKKNTFFHLQSVNGFTYITHITKNDEDFSTSYESLWKELRFLYECESATADLMLNTIRRIIETYIHFNSISCNKFYSDLPGAKKLFDVNSHAIDDLTAELNGKSKDDLVNLLAECFKKNDAQEHFNCHWKIDK